MAALMSLAAAETVLRPEATAENCSKSFEHDQIVVKCKNLSIAEIPKNLDGETEVRFDIRL